MLYSLICQHLYSEYKLQHTLDLHLSICKKALLN